MTSTNVIQFSIQLSNGRIMVVGGSTPTEFNENYTELFGDSALDYLMVECVNALGPPAYTAAPPNPQAGPPDFVPQQYHDQMQSPQQWQPQAPPAPVGPTTPQEYCEHGPKNWRPAGISKKTNKPYAGFWACPAPMGMQCPPPRRS